MEIRIKRIGEPNKYELALRRTKGWERTTKSDAKILAVITYLQLRGDIILNDDDLKWLPSKLRKEFFEECKRVLELPPP